MNDVFGEQLGQYILLEQLGEGGMAKVYNALDSRVERNVAIKVILPSKRTSSVFLQQFEREAKALANLTHTNIVKVLNYGVQNGQPYLVMEYVSGGTLKEAMNQKIPWQTAAAILAPIARALDYVHQQQIVHRDVKPSNILLQDDFRPMLSDFGILKMLEAKDEKSDSAIGAGIGTPEYMPPEQGMGKDVDFRADIYSLGLVFYEMITGQKPYTADSPMAIVIKHVTDELPLPSRIDRNIPKFVERAILRAVQKDPKNRYLSMGHFADVLELIALGDKASPQKINKAAREREKRQRSVSIWSLSILLVVLILGTSYFGYNYFTGAYSESPPTAAPTRAATKTLVPTMPPTRAATSLPTEAPIVTPELGPAADLSLLGTPISTGSGSRFTEIARWGIGGVNVVTWSPDGKTIALGTTSGIFFFDAQTREQTLFIDTQFNVLTLAFNLSGEEIAAGSRTGVVQVWNARNGVSLRTYSYARPNSETITENKTVTAISYSLDGKNVAIGFQNGAINYFSSDRAALGLALENYPTITDLVLSRDNRFIYASNGSKDITVWDIQYQTKTTLSNPTAVNKLSLSPDQQFLLAGGGGGNSIQLWDFDSSTNVTSFPNLGGRATDFDFSHDGKYVVIALNSGDIKVFEMPATADYSKTLVPKLSFKGYGQQILSLASAPDQFVFATGNHEEGLKLWDTQTGANTFSLNQSLRAIEELYLSGDGLWLASAHVDGLVRVWDVNNAKEAYAPFEGYLPKGLPFSPDNRFLTYIYSPGGNRNNIIRVMELRTGKIVAELPDLASYIQTPFVQFTADSRLLITGDAYQARMWDVATWEQVNMHGGPNAGCGQFFTPQNELLALISRAGIRFAYDQKMEELCGIKPPGVIMMYYFHEPHKIAFVLANGDLKILHANSVEINRIESDASYPLPGDIFLAGDEASGWYAYAADGNINIENINGAAGAVINSQDDYKYRIALLPGQKLMALGSRYGSIHIWTMP
jgi:WD40 repeat protein/predicted Ser/Thr protein kinase